MNRLSAAFRPDDGRDLVRVVAGILVALGLVLIAVRRGTPGFFGESSDELTILLVYASAAVLLYGIGLLGRSATGTDRRWQALYTVLGTLILPLALFQLAATIDSGYDGSLVAIFVFTACAAACGAAWLIAAVRYQLLLGAVYFALAWVAFVNEVLGDGIGTDIDTVRALVLLFAAVLLGAAFAVRSRARVEPEAAFGELLTGAGVAALIAYSLGVVTALAAVFFASLGPLAGLIAPSPGELSGQDGIWDVLTLLTAIGLIVFGVGRGLRGQVYVGALMMLLFLASVGLDLDDPSPEPAVVGWPLLLCAAGAGLFALSVSERARIPAKVGGWFSGGRE